jgi:V/A-type H+-transporting ATPase subunit I
MSRLMVVASKDQMEPVISELYRNHVFHIEDFVDSGKEDYTGFRIGVPLPGAGEVSGELLKLRAIENAFSIDRETIVTPKSGQAALRKRIEQELPAIEKDVEGLMSRRSAIDNRIKDCQQKIEALSPFLPLPVPLELLCSYDTMSVHAGYVAHNVELAAPAEVWYQPSKAGNFIVLVTPANQKEEVEKALTAAQFSSVPVPVENGTAAERKAGYEGQIQTLEGELKEINDKLGQVKKEHEGFLVACEELLHADVEQSEAPLRFATTDLAFIAEGWVPSDRADAVTAALNRVTSGKVLVSRLEFDPTKDAVPVEYNNPSFSKPTELFMDVYSRPRYSEIDPTLLVSIIFPLFFGLILGDVGYGIILLIMSLALMRFFKTEGATMFIKVLRNASISSIIFGVLFSEFLGFSLPWSPILFSRHLNIGGEASEHASAIPQLMVLAIWIGILHITLGRVLGMINHARMDHGSHRTKTVMANFGWIITMWGILFMIWSAFPIPLMPDFTKLPAIAGLNPAVIIGAVMVVLGIIFIARENVLDVIEIPTIVSHVLSYARLVAVGLSSVAIAMVTNYISIGMMIQPRLVELHPINILIVIMGGFVFLLGHTMNTALGILGGGLHSIRLQYVEFFTKFYKGGGEKYTPFGMKRQFTED